MGRPLTHQPTKGLIEKMRMYTCKGDPSRPGPGQRICLSGLSVLFLARPAPSVLWIGGGPDGDVFIIAMSTCAPTGGPDSDVFIIAMSTCALTVQTNRFVGPGPVETELPCMYTCAFFYEQTKGCPGSRVHGGHGLAISPFARCPFLGLRSVPNSTRHGLEPRMVLTLLRAQSPQVLWF